jgi:hypothetical protein
LEPKNNLRRVLWTCCTTPTLLLSNKKEKKKIEKKKKKEIPIHCRVEVKKSLLAVCVSPPPPKAHLPVNSRFAKKKKKNRSRDLFSEEHATHLCITVSAQRIRHRT